MSVNSFTIAGNLVTDPELRFTPSGQAVARFTVAYSERYRDNATGEWKDGDTSYFDVYAWNDLGEHVAETFQRGNRVIVTGAFRMRTWETAELEKRRTYEIRAADVGASVLFATARITKTTRAKPGTPEPDPWEGENPAASTAASTERPRLPARSEAETTARDMVERQASAADESQAEPGADGPQEPADSPAAGSAGNGPKRSGSRSRARTTAA